jgi:hypothetical protein
VTRLGEFSSNEWLFTLSSFIKKFRRGPYFWATFFHGKGCGCFFQKMGWATFWTIFFTNSSGHPALCPRPDQLRLRLQDLSWNGIVCTHYITAEQYLCKSISTLLTSATCRCYQWPLYSNLSLRPAVNFDPRRQNLTPRGEVGTQGWTLSTRGWSYLPGWPSVCPFVFLQRRAYSPVGVNEGVNISPRGQSSPLGANFIPRGKLHPWGQTMLLKKPLFTWYLVGCYQSVFLSMKMVH